MAVGSSDVGEGGVMKIVLMGREHMKMFFEVGVPWWSVFSMLKQEVEEFSSGVGCLRRLMVLSDKKKKK